MTTHTPQVPVCISHLVKKLTFNPRWRTQLAPHHPSLGPKFTNKINNTTTKNFFHWVSPVSVRSTGSGHIVTPLKELLRSPSPSCAELRVEFGTSRGIRSGLSVNLDSLAPPCLSLLPLSSLLHSVLSSPLRSSWRSSSWHCLSVCLDDENTNQPPGRGFSRDARLPKMRRGREERVLGVKTIWMSLTFSHVHKWY